MSQQRVLQPRHPNICAAPATGQETFLHREQGGGRPDDQLHSGDYFITLLATVIPGNKFTTLAWQGAEFICECTGVADPPAGA